MRLAVLFLDLRVSCAEHDVDRVRMPREDRGERVDDVLDPLVRRQEAENVKITCFAHHAEAILAVAGVRRDPDSVGNQIDLRGRYVMDVAQERGTVLAHQDHALGQRTYLVHDSPLHRVRFAQNGVERGDDGHPELPEDRQDVRAPAFPPKIPYCSSTHTTSKLLTVRKSAARR